MSRIVIDENRCKGCLLCTIVCPTSLIRQSGRFNPTGYKPAELPHEDMEKCSGCASCAKICPDYAITVWKTSKTKTAEKTGEES
jgi:2-oxoglutarate ferredoxin oxidoreductase subunit delta